MLVPLFYEPLFYPSELMIFIGIILCISLQLYILKIVKENRKDILEKKKK